MNSIRREETSLVSEMTEGTTEVMLAKKKLNKQSGMISSQVLILCSYWCVFQGMQWSTPKEIQENMSLRFIWIASKEEKLIIKAYLMSELVQFLFPTIDALLHPSLPWACRGWLTSGDCITRFPASNRLWPLRGRIPESWRKESSGYFFPDSSLFWG